MFQVFFCEKIFCKTKYLLKLNILFADSDTAEYVADFDPAEYDPSFKSACVFVIGMTSHIFVFVSSFYSLVDMVGEGVFYMLIRHKENDTQHINTFSKILILIWK